jgi:hypothetical protein
MALTTAGRLLALVGSGSLALALQAPAHAADATFTRITTPSAGATFFDKGGTPTMHVSGTASTNLTSVDVVCLGGSGGSAVATPVATNVSVTGGSFTVTAPVPTGAVPVCRLRAVPSTSGVQGDLSPFSGPIVHIDRLQRLTQSSSTFDFNLTAGSGDGVMAVHSAGNCGDSLLGSLPHELGNPGASRSCVADLGPSAAAGSTGPLRVDGHLALLPDSVLAFGDASTSLHLAVHLAKSGRVTWTESAPLVRCQGTDTDPPPVGHCDTVLATGVKFTRSGTFAADGDQIRLRDSFSSTDGRKHRVLTVYGMGWNPPATGALGFAFPGHGKGFHGSTKGEVVAGLPKHAATLLVRSDRFADEGDPMVVTRALTWSRPPSRVAFASSDASELGLHYTLSVPKGGAARLGFTDGVDVRTSSARSIGTSAVAGVMPSPTITSPGVNAVVSGKKTVVQGVVRAGVNGLPVSVRVNGHVAALDVRSATKATYRVVFDEPLGKHTITAVARDAGNNTRSTSTTVRNK